MIRGSKGKIVSGVNTSQGVIETIEQYYENGWTDGFPIVPPTEDAVSDMINASGRDPYEVLGVVPPRNGVATVEMVATNAVMAGCKPEYMPVVLAAVEALLDEEKHTFKNDGDQIVDEEPGSMWSIRGEAVEGPLAGKKLTSVVHASSFWFAVAIFKPDTKVYQGR